MTAGRRDQLASALRDPLSAATEWPTALELADALLPIVDAICAEAYAQGWRDGHDADCGCHS